MCMTQFLPLGIFLSMNRQFHYIIALAILEEIWAAIGPN